MTLVALFSPDWESRPHPDNAVLLLHGFGSNERDLPGIVAQLGVDAPMVSLRAPLELDDGAYAWFPLDAELNITREPVEDATNIVWQWVDENIDPETKLIVVGFSQGGCMATQLLRTKPERIADTVILSGFVLDGPQPADGRLATLLPRVFWGRGTADTVIPPTLVAAASARLDALTTLTVRIYEGLPHSVDDRELADVKAHLARGHLV
jgi:phospholipase/carboxylesterase